MATERRGGWCEPFGPDAWSSVTDEPRCENGAAFRVTAAVPATETGNGGTVSLNTCVRHVGFAAATLLHHGAVSVAWIDE